MLDLVHISDVCHAYVKAYEYICNQTFSRVCIFGVCTGKNDKEIVGCLDGETRIKKEFNVEIISNAINFILPDVEINKYQ